jgi:hypothetical protein
MGLGVGGHFNVKVITRLGTHKGHQVAGVAEFAAHAIAAGQVTAQSHDALNACRTHRRQPLADAVERLADAAQVRGCSAALGHDLGHGLQRAVLRGAAGAKSDRAELGLQGIQLLARGAQLRRPRASWSGKIQD